MCFSAMRKVSIPSRKSSKHREIQGRFIERNADGKKPDKIYLTKQINYRINVCDL